MKRSLCLIALLTLATGLAGAQTFPTYFSTSDLAFTSPGALKYGLYGFDNPALLTCVRHPDMEFVWTDATGRWNSFNRWGLFTAVPNFGFGAVTTKTGSASLTDYRLSLGFGDRSLGFGIGYSFSGGDKAAFDRRNSWTLGALLRPTPYLSVGLVGTATGSGGRSEGVVDLGLRPLGSELVTLFADYAIQDHQRLGAGAWSTGAALEPLAGIRITGRYFDTHAFSVGLTVSLGNAGLSTQSTYDSDARHAFNTYALRLGAFDRTLVTKLAKDSRYVSLDLNGPMKYQRYRFFDNASTLSGTLTAIEAAKTDETVAGVAINTSGMRINREMLWELRQALKELKTAGKKVVVFIDRADLDDYRLASVADRIVLDPQGAILLPGYVMGRTYYKGTLEKLGIGYDEWRYFKYKTAAEAFSRDAMSDADREQFGQYTNDIYAQTKADICEGRRIAPERFDQLVNEAAIFLPREAMANGLADTLGRWDEVGAILDRLEGSKTPLNGVASLADFNLPYDNLWGDRPRIAVIYALGECAMDAGIRARSLVKDVEAAGNDPKIRAIVLRVDSPGGDALASDYIAEALKKIKRSKPVVISQGSVAGSGGYWLSMYGDTIVAAPSTVTGSIGVIGGWMYNKGLKEMLGFSTGFVKAGEHADLGFGFTLPFIGLGLPDRNLTDAERNAAGLTIKSMYRDFVGKVAEGRKMTADTVESIAQGRFYSGTEGKRLGLVDVLGGLVDAVRLAQRRAGIDEKADIAVVEIPRPGLFDLGRLLPFGANTAAAGPAGPRLEHLKFRLEHNGEPLPLMPLDTMEEDIPRE